MSFLTPLAAPTPARRAQRQRSIRQATDALLSHVTGPDSDPTANVLRTLADATDADVTEGLAWYLTANAHAHELATLHSITLAQAAGIIAALSPQTGWLTNLQLAANLCTDPDTNPGHFADAYDKAVRIYHGARPEDVLRGRKVRSFYANILRPDRPGPVTIDRHAIDILTGTRLFATTPAAKILERPGAYTYAASVYRSTARLIPHPTQTTRSLYPHELQAITWVAHRNAHYASLNF
jgi:hypothetical protein